MHTLTTSLYTLSLHDALPILGRLAVELAAAVEGHRVGAVPFDDLPEPRRRPAERIRPPHRTEFLVACRAHVGLHQAVGDRKSTRLNSSHLGISYAVFCLKKKK